MHIFSKLWEVSKLFFIIGEIFSAFHVVNISKLNILKRNINYTCQGPDNNILIIKKQGFCTVSQCLLVI